MIQQFKQTRFMHVLALTMATFGLGLFSNPAAGSDLDHASGAGAGATVESSNQFTLGDMNEDGNVDGLDIDLFVLELTGDQASQGNSGQQPGDMNDDNGVDGLDIDLFVQALTTGGTSGNGDAQEPASTPTPSAFSAAMLVGALTLLRRRRHP